GHIQFTYEVRSIAAQSDLFLSMPHVKRNAIGIPPDLLTQPLRLRVNVVDGVDLHGTPRAQVVEGLEQAHGQLAMFYRDPQITRSCTFRQLLTGQRRKKRSDPRFAILKSGQGFNEQAAEVLSVMVRYVQAAGPYGSAAVEEMHPLAILF